MGLKLRNQGTAEICETGELDGPGNSWAWGGTESYAFIYSRTIVCANFRPRELRKAKLQFKFHFHSSCIDHSATSLSLHIVQLVWKALVHPIKWLDGLWFWNFCWINQYQITLCNYAVIQQYITLSLSDPGITWIFLHSHRGWWKICSSILSLTQFLSERRVSFVQVLNLTIILLKKVLAWTVVVD